MRVIANRNCMVEIWKLIKGLEHDVPDEIGWTLVERGYARQKWDPSPPVAVPKKRGK